MLQKKRLLALAQIPEGKKVQVVTVRTPDDRSTEIIKFNQRKGEASFAVPQLAIYNMIEIKLN